MINCWTVGGVGDDWVPDHSIGRPISNSCLFHLQDRFFQYQNGVPAVMENLNKFWNSWIGRKSFGNLALFIFVSRLVPQRGNVRSQ